MRRLAIVLGLFLVGALASLAAEIVLPMTRTAYYARESVELAVAGLAKGAHATVALTPAQPGLATFAFEVIGDGAAVNTILPPYTLAPGDYNIILDGKDVKLKLTIARGVPDSPMLFSQAATLEEIKSGGGNFIPGHLVNGRGILDPNGLPSKNPRKLGTDLRDIEKAIAADLPSQIYMCYSGYVTHKPWGSQKTWEEAAMNEMMRFYNFSAVQAARRVSANLFAVGLLDEPGLNLGYPPTGTFQMGPFPPPDARAWYEARGAAFTNDPGALPDADYLKFMRVRAAVIGEIYRQAHNDMAAVWPDVPFATDVYAGWDIHDGADPANQRANTLPATHVFAESWGTPRSHIATMLFFEKSCRPTDPVVHIMNGQLHGATVPQPQARTVYHLMTGSLLQAGLYSNWWLQLGAMKPEDFNAVNEPARRLGPLFRAMAPADTDVAILYSLTEQAMRGKAIAYQAARLGKGEKFDVTFTRLPQNPLGLTELATKQDGSFIYRCEEEYCYEIMNVHMALSRLGYPAHILHEYALPDLLKNYKVLVIIGQTSALPAETRKAIEQFMAKGGTVITDRATTVAIKGAKPSDIDVKELYLGMQAYREAARRPEYQLPPRALSLLEANFPLNEAIRSSLPAVQAALRGTKARACVTTEATDLISARHVGGQGSLVMVQNGHEELPELPETQKYLIWNYAPYQASYALANLPKKCVVYRFEGLDWQQVSKLENPAALQTARFAPGEMKLYLVAPSNPTGIKASVKVTGGALQVTASLQGPKMPWPFTVTITDPQHHQLLQVWRAMGVKGTYAETFPIGTNAPTGPYTITLTSPAGKLKTEVMVTYNALMTSTPSSETVRVFEESAIRAFLAGKPEVVIALGNAAYRAAADRLAVNLQARGIAARVADETSVLGRARYPRIFDPYVILNIAAGEERKPSGEVKLRATVNWEDDGRVTALAEDGKDVSATWFAPGTLVTVGPKGYLQWVFTEQEQAFEPGTLFYVNAAKRLELVKGTRTEITSDAAFRARWSRPWATLNAGTLALQLPPRLPEAYTAPAHLILLGDSDGSAAVAALQASEILPQVVDAKYPGSGKALVEFAWSPFALDKNVIFIGASDDAGVQAGITRLLTLAPPGR